MRLGWHLADCCRGRTPAVVMRRYVEDLAFVIDGTPQIHPLAGDGNDDLIQVPPPRSPGTVASSRLGFFDGMRPKVRFATDSALEGRGFELSVPRNRERTSGSKSDLQEKPRPKHTSGGIRLPITRLPSLGAHPDQPSRNLPPPPFLFRHRPARQGAWRGADDLR